MRDEGLCMACSTEPCAEHAEDTRPALAEAREMLLRAATWPVDDNQGLRYHALKVAQTIQSALDQPNLGAGERPDAAGPQDACSSCLQQNGAHAAGCDYVRTLERFAARHAPRAGDAAGPAEPPLEQVLAQLRHLYQQMARGYDIPGMRVRSMADGLLAPQIRKLEALAEAGRAAQPTPQGCEGDCNPHTAPCGAKFCTYEEMAAHRCVAPAPVETPQGEK